MSLKRIKWHFNPPSAPHMGGVWKGLIRIDGALKEPVPKEETLVEIESILYFRQLTYIPVDPDAPEVLTPNNCLIGSSNTYLPGDESECDILKEQWRNAQKISNKFCKRLLEEYLNRRKKLLEETINLKEGDIVCIADSNLQRKCCPLGRIIKTFPGKDGVAWVAEVRTQAGVFKLDVETKQQVWRHFFTRGGTFYLLWSYSIMS